VLQDLVNRRVPHVLAVYLGGSWAVVEFFAFMEDRFLLSPHLTNLVLALLVVFLPSVLLFTYFHGRKGRDSWTQTEKVFIPLNILFALVVLFLGFSGKELGAVTTTLTLEDEDGNAVERTVVKEGFRKTLALFPLASDTTDPETAWLGGAVKTGLLNDLFQDMFINLRLGAEFQEKIEEAGYASAVAAPRSLLRSLCSDANVPYFVDGEVTRTEAGYRVAVALNDVARGRVVSERVHEGGDLLALIDSASIQLRRDLDLPARHLEETPDLPVSEHTTASVTALRRYAEAYEALTVRDDFGAAASGLSDALEEDPGYADAAFTLYQVRAMSGNVAGAVPALQTAMDNLHRLPERWHYQIKAEWYAIQQDLPRAFAVYEMWAELYPEDIAAQTYAAQVRLYQDDREGAIEALETVLELDPTRIALLPQIGRLYETLGDNAEARRYYERHVEAAPEDESSLLALAGLHRRTGDHEGARALYERAELLAPGDIDVAAAIASLDRDVGRFDQALQRYQDALESARTGPQRFTVLAGLAGLHLARGQVAEALDYAEERWQLAAFFMAPVQRLQGRLLDLRLYPRAGRAEEALALLDSLEAQLEPPQDALVPLGRMSLYEAMERPDELEAAVAEATAMMERTGLQALEGDIAYFSGRVRELRGDFEGAITVYEREQELNPSDTSVPNQLGRCYREMGELDRAEELIIQTLSARPSHAQARVELAKVYERMGRLDDAIAQVEQALVTWAPADPEYRPAQEARELLAGLRSRAD
jgi:tetratricopeptide (TPR) repeat protein